MKTNRFTGLMLAALCCGVVSCSDKWDDHYDARNIVSADIEIYSGDVAAYMKSQPSLSKITGLFQSTGILPTITPDGEYTLVLCENDALDMSVIDNDTAFVKNSISDIAVSPDK